MAHFPQRKNQNSNILNIFYIVFFCIELNLLQLCDEWGPKHWQDQGNRAEENHGHCGDHGQFVVLVSSVVLGTFILFSVHWPDFKSNLPDLLHRLAVQYITSFSHRTIRAIRTSKHHITVLLLSVDWAQTLELIFVHEWGQHLSTQEQHRHKSSSIILHNHVSCYGSQFRFGAWCEPLFVLFGKPKRFGVHPVKSVLFSTKNIEIDVAKVEMQNT